MNKEPKILVLLPFKMEGEEFITSVTNMVYRVLADTGIFPNFDERCIRYTYYFAQFQQFAARMLRKVRSDMDVHAHRLRPSIKHLPQNN